MKKEIPWKDFFTLSKKDRIGMSVMVILTLILWGWGEISNKKNMNSFASILTPYRGEVNPDLSATEEMDSLPPFASRRSTSPSPASKLFLFDPNTLEEEGWQLLGLSAKTIRTIVNFRNKGGRFRLPEDLQKIYGLTGELVEKLTPYVRITAKANSETQKPSVLQAPKNFRTVQRLNPIEVNEADSIAWEALPGIGPKLAQRILRFREALGGYVSIDQLREVYGLEDSVFMRIEPLLRLTEKQAAKLFINDISERELARHPYIGKSIARLLVAYRTQHGELDEASVRNTPGLTEEKWKKLEPYISFNAKSSS